MSGSCGDNCTWNYDAATETLTISGKGEMWDVGYFPEQASVWSRYSQWDNYAETIENVVVEEGITSISKCAFLWFQNLKSVSLPTTLLNIGPQAFAQTAWLDALREQDPVVIVDDILIDAQTYTGTALTIPENVKLIAGGACLKNQTLESVVIPESVIGIGGRAFFGCTALKDVSLPKQVEWFGDLVFGYPDDYSATPFLQENISADGFTVFASALIQAPAGQKDIKVPENVSVIADYADFGDAKNIVFPENVKRIGLFSYNTQEKLKALL